MSCCRVVIPQPHPWSRRFRQVYPAASFELPSDFSILCLRLFGTRNLFVAVDKSVLQLWIAFAVSIGTFLGLGLQISELCSVFFWAPSGDPVLLLLRLVCSHFAGVLQVTTLDVSHSLARPRNC
jgi:hypothetical protein